MIAFRCTDLRHPAEAADFTHLEKRQARCDHGRPDILWQIGVIHEYRSIAQPTQLVTAAAIFAIGLRTSCHSLAINGNGIRQIVLQTQKPRATHYFGTINTASTKGSV